MNWISRMLSDNGEPSSKRVAGMIAVLVLVTVFACVFAKNLPVSENQLKAFQGLLIFAAACFGLNVVKDVFAKKPTPDEPPEGDKP